MPRKTLDEARARFGHVDARFESCVVSLPGPSHYAVRFYPWWENPSYVEAMESGASWQGTWPSEAERTVTVHPVELIRAHLRRTVDVVDWTFIDSTHPLLWEFEDTMDVLCQHPLPPGSLAELPARIATALPYTADPGSVASLLNPFVWRSPRAIEHGRGGFSLGQLPASVAEAAARVLDELSVHYLEQRRVGTAERLPKMLLIDGEDYLVADDFILDVPDFEHRPEWVTSSPKA